MELGLWFAWEQCLKRFRHIPVTLTIAGSDSGGGAGIQADLKTFAVMGTFGTSAITCVTAQNPDGVRGVSALSPAMVKAQIEAVCSAFPVAAAKTGMLFSAPIIRAVARTIRLYKIDCLVVDPVMVATSGGRLLRPEAVRALEHELLPLARLVTPNIPEAGVLLGKRISNLPDAVAAAVTLARRYGNSWLIKGGHLPGAMITDVLVDRSRIVLFRSRRIRVRETHGTGCTLSAAITALLARGHDMRSAVQKGRRFVHRALATARPAGRHIPLNLLSFRVRP